MAYTGARGGETTQLRASDVEERPGIGVVVKTTPEAGTVKTGKVRVVRSMWTSVNKCWPMLTW